MVRRFGRGMAVAAAAMVVMLSVVDIAEARRAGSGFGSRGTRTFSAAPATRTAPNTAAPIERTMTPGQASQPAAGQRTPAQTPGQAAGGQTAGRPGGFFGGFAGSMLGGLALGGLIGMMMGNGLGGAAGLLGLLLQVGLVIGAVMLAMRFFGRRQQPAYGGAARGMGASAGSSPNPLGGNPLGAGFSARNAAGPSATPSFQIPRIGGGGAPVPAQQAAARSAEDADEIGVTGEDLDQFETMLKAVQAAYGAEDYGALRKLTTPEAMSWLAEELSENATKGVKNDVRDVQLVQGDVAEAWNENGDDYTTVAMRYESIDVVRDRTSGQVVEGNPDEPTETVELWTFLRKRGGEWQVSAIQGEDA